MAIYLNGIFQSGADVLPIEQGGTGQTTAAAAAAALLPSQANNAGKVLGTDGTNLSWVTGGGGGGSGTVTSVDVSAGSTGLTASGGPITGSGTITLGGMLNVTSGGTGRDSFSNGYVTVAGNSMSSTPTIPAADISGDISGNANNVTGIVAIGNGGTGANTATAAVNNLLPSQGGNADRFLKTDGTNVSWGIPGTVFSVDIDGGNTGMTFTGGPITDAGVFTMDGTLSISNGGTGYTNAIDAFNALAPSQSGANGRFLRSNGLGTAPSWVALSNTIITGALGYTPVNRAGDTMTGTLTLSANPTQALQAATKQYVDSIASGVVIKQSVVTATANNLTASYDNGTSGVGATLIGTGSMPSLSGVTPTVGQRVLVKDQTSTFQNGIYTVTTDTPYWTLTRATDYNGSANGAIQSGDTVLVAQGSLEGTQWTQITTGVITVGTSPIVWTQYSSPSTVFAGTGIFVNGNEINNTGVLSLTADTGINLSGSNGDITISVSSVPIANGGTGANTAQGALNNLVGNQSNTVLRSNGANVALGKLVLSTDVTGTLSISNGGTGANTAAGAINNLLPSQANNAGRVLTTDGSVASWTSASAGTVRSVSMSGANTGLSFTGGPITDTGTFTLTGTLAITNGGTGGITRAQGLNNLLPSQTSNNGKFLTTDGTNASWVTANTLPNQTGNSGKYLTTDGTTASWAAVSGNGTVTSVAMSVPAFLTVTGSPITTNGTFAISYSGTALPIANGGTGSTSASAAINALLPSQVGNSGQVLTTNGTTASWSAAGTGSVTSVAMSVPAFLTVTGSPITTNGTFAISYSGTALPIANGGTGATTANNAIANLLPSQTGNNNKFLTTDGTTLSWGNATAAAAGSNTQIQFNDDGALAGSSNLTFSGGSLTAANDMTVSGLRVGKGTYYTSSYSRNTALGVSVLASNYSGVDNTGIGNQALAANYNGRDNTGVGSYSLNSNYSGVQNTSLGSHALQVATSASNLTAIGYNALTFSTAGTGLTAVGSRAMENNTIGNYNTAVGYLALLDNAQGDYNTAMGYNALSNSLNVEHNTGIGNQALQSTVSGEYNTAVGSRSGFTNNSGSYNTLIGYQAGYNLTTGGYNTIIGSVLGVAGMSNTVIIAAGTDERLRINQNGAWSTNAGTDYGTSGYVLTSNGPNSPPSWQAGGGGGGGGSGTVTSVNVSGANTGITFTGGPITSNGTITMTGTLAVANGGTGGTTATAAITNLLPSQANNSGKVLTTNGTTVSWANGVTSVAVSGGSTGLTTSGGPITTTGTITLGGTLAIANGGTGATTANAAVAALLPSQTGNSGRVLTTDGSNVSWIMAATGTVTNVAISGGSTGLTTSGGPITSNGTITLGGTLAIANGGTGANTATAAITNLLPSQTGNTNLYLRTNGSGTLSWAGITTLANGTSNVSISTANSDVTISVANTSNVVTVSNTGMTITGNLVTGNLVATTNINSTRIVPRVNNNGAVTSGTLTPNGNTTDQYNIIGLTGTTTIQDPSGTPTDGQKLMIRIKDAGSSQTLNWGATYRPINVVIPTATTAGKTTYVGCIYNSQDGAWDVVAIVTQA